LRYSISYFSFFLALFAKPVTIISAPKSKGIKGAPVGSMGTVEVLTFCCDDVICDGLTCFVGTLGTEPICTVAVTSCPIVVAVLITVVPATDAVGVTNRFNTALAPLAIVPTFHNPLTLL
jgi:hypothetical protein